MKSLILCFCTYFISTFSWAGGSITGYNAWYVLKTADGTPLMKWNESLTPTPDQLKFELKIWKQEDGVINEEFEGAFAHHTPDLVPKFFNLSRTFQGSTLQVDGTVQANQLVIKVRMEGQSANRPAQRVLVSKGTILNAFFPVWLKINHSTLDSKKWTKLQTIPEDDPQMVFRPTMAKLKKSPQGVDVDYRGLKSRWILDQDGVATSIELQSLKAIATRISAKEAAEILSTK